MINAFVLLDKTYFWLKMHQANIRGPVTPSSADGAPYTHSPLSHFNKTCKWVARKVINIFQIINYLTCISFQVRAAIITQLGKCPAHAHRQVYPTSTSKVRVALMSNVDHCIPFLWCYSWSKFSLRNFRFSKHLSLRSHFYLDKFYCNYFFFLSKAIKIFWQVFPLWKTSSLL